MYANRFLKHTEYRFLTIVEKIFKVRSRFLRQNEWREYEVSPPGFWIQGLVQDLGFRERNRAASKFPLDHG